MGKAEIEDPELRELVSRMRAVQANAYGLFFSAGMGSDCHAFLEINGVIGKFVDLCERAAKKGIDFRMANIHTGQPLPMAGHDADYLAEKLLCMFGPALRANPEVRRRLLHHIQDGTES